MQEDPGDERLYHHLTTILSVSGAMVGVCLSTIGIIGMIKSLRQFDTLCDDLLAADAFLFLSSAILSFLLVRTPLLATSSYRRGRDRRHLLSGTCRHGDGVRHAGVGRALRSQDRYAPA